MKLSAVIFDLDGTILEDEDEYGKAFNKVLKSLGIDAKTGFPHDRGIGVKENWDNLIKKYSIKTDKTSYILAKETQEAYLELISEVTVRPGFDEFVENLKDSGAKVALATSNTWEQTDKILSITNLQGIFDVVVTGDEVLYNKPDPEIFTVASDKLGIEERNECLVVEDSMAGIEAAKCAGMKVIGILDNDENEVNVSKADIVVEGFSEITPQAVDQL